MSSTILILELRTVTVAASLTFKTLDALFIVKLDKRKEPLLTVNLEKALLSEERSKSVLADVSSELFTLEPFKSNVTFSDTISGKIYNAVFMANGASLTLRAVNSGNITFNDTIDGGNVDSSLSTVSYGNKYSMSITGDGTGSVVNLFNTMYEKSHSIDILILYNFLNWRFSFWNFFS